MVPKVTGPTPRAFCTPCSDLDGQTTDVNRGSIHVIHDALPFPAFHSEYPTLSRLWCIFEMAAFLKTHSLGGLLVQPLYMASFVLACNLVNTMAMFVDLVLPYESHFTVYMYILGLCAYAWLAGTAVVHFSESVTTAEQQLMTFKVANAQCYCCFVGHQVNGGELQCDRKVILQCLQHWFSSIQEFEKNVQNRVRKALTHQFHRCKQAISDVSRFSTLYEIHTEHLLVQSPMWTSARVCCHFLFSRARRYLDPPKPPQTPSQKVLGVLGINIPCLWVHGSVDP